MNIRSFRWFIFLLLSLAVSMLLVQPVMAQSGSAFRFEIRRNATPEAYYVHVLFQGAEPADITTVPQQGGITIRYKAKQEQREQFDNGGVRFFSSSQALNSRIGIPPDGDTSKMRRIDKPGWIQLIIPRSRR
jgi:hypothetical protein